uniref:Ribosomal protein S3 n=1 Tax=Welwitschia mirabilis TaxID=3377 RepID=A0A0X9UH78_WELMI|nr:ribosomal protein S3 [Welwitschia mirabilis]AMA21016.1 ribosomal protein S3 [Welwitschia mirabilis]
MSSWFSDYYYGCLLYQDVNQRDYFGSIRPPTRGSLGFRLGRCILNHSHTRTFIHLFIPRRPLKRRLIRRVRSGPGRWWAFGFVRLIGPGVGEDRNEVRGARSEGRIKRANMTGVRAGETVKSTGLHAGEELRFVRIWPRTSYSRWRGTSSLMTIRTNMGYGRLQNTSTTQVLRRVSGWMAHKHPMSAHIYAADTMSGNGCASSSVSQGNQYCSCPGNTTTGTTLTVLEQLRRDQLRRVTGFAGSKASTARVLEQRGGVTPIAGSISEATILSLVYRHSRTRAPSACSLVRGLLVAYWGRPLNRSILAGACFEQLNRLWEFESPGNSTNRRGFTKFFKRCLLPFRFGPTSQIQLLSQTIPAVRPSLLFSVMQYFLNMENHQTGYISTGLERSSTCSGYRSEGGRVSYESADPVVVPFLIQVAPGEPGRADRQERGEWIDREIEEKRIRSRLCSSGHLSSPVGRGIGPTTSPHWGHLSSPSRGRSDKCSLRELLSEAMVLEGRAAIISSCWSIPPHSWCTLPNKGVGTTKGIVSQQPPSFQRSSVDVTRQSRDALPLREQLRVALNSLLKASLLGTSERALRKAYLPPCNGKGCFNLSLSVTADDPLSDRSGLGGSKLVRGIGMMIWSLLKNRRIPYGYNYYNNEVRYKRVQMLCNRTNTSNFIGSVKIPYNYQSASLIAQDISNQLRGRNRTRSFRSLVSYLVRFVPVRVNPSASVRVRGIRICCSGRLKGAEIAYTECGEYGKTSAPSSIYRREGVIDHASVHVSTRYGIYGVKVWISYSSVNIRGRVCE